MMHARGAWGNAWHTRLPFPSSMAKAPRTQMSCKVRKYETHVFHTVWSTRMAVCVSTRYHAMRRTDIKGCRRENEAVRMYETTLLLGVSRQACTYHARHNTFRLELQATELYTIAVSEVLCGKSTNCTGHGAERR